ncbi:hypothetical protein [Mycolicibacterium obuense]|uniref:hypothetical protein n=1 Tax=Mycolicibacterium obuense TaxID=1807 RepID=UPI000A8BD5DD|nr:hypothetical protein [Mycolicibacterium obuense]
MSYSDGAGPGHHLVVDESCDVSSDDSHEVVVASVWRRVPAGFGARARLDPFDREILDFVAMWAPYGGPPDEQCLPLFGLTPGQLRQRVLMLIAASRHRRYCPADCAALGRVSLVVGHVASDDHSTDHDM